MLPSRWSPWFVQLRVSRGHACAEPVLDSAGIARQLLTGPTRAGAGRVEKIALRVDAECGQAETIAVRDYSSTERQAAASKTPGGDFSDPAAVHDEFSDQFVVARAMARRCGEVAALHLEIRRWQEAIGQNRFADIYDSQPDLRDGPGLLRDAWWQLLVRHDRYRRDRRVRGAEERRERDRLSEASCRCPPLPVPRRWIPADSGVGQLGATGGVL